VILWLLIGGGTVAVLVLLGRYNRARVAREWDMTLGPHVLRDIDALDRQTMVDRMMADDSAEAALRAQVAADAPEVLRLLELAYQVLETATADRVVRLRGVRVCARMAAALAPTAPLLPRDFRLVEVRTLTGLARMVHHVLVGSAERFVMKARVISFGLGLSLRAMRRARDREALEDALRRFDAAKADWKTLDVAHVEMVRELIVSVAATRRGVVAARP
jgi:hypothetical protein